MPFPQLPGHTIPSAVATPGRAILGAVLALASILVVAAWRLLPHEATVAPQSLTTASTTAPLAPDPQKHAASDDQQLHLAHAEEELLTAAEQLTTARRLLAAVSPGLERSYLQFEKRRTDSAWTACDAAQRAIEQARDDIKSMSLTRKAQ